jgi:3D-(3,5/4)-trihydroxycyclohexane-1,2-dione acylhydrolase (decyclizing)
MFSVAEEIRPRRSQKMASGSRSKTTRLTMSQALVKYISAQFSERDSHERRLVPAIFGIFGHGNVAGIGQALYEYGKDLPYYHSYNEQSMVHTACGFAKANNRLATLACTASIGPGSTNMITGAALATINRLPALLLPSDYYATHHQGPVLQQLEHPISADVSVNDCFRPVSRFFDRISRPEQLLASLPEAMRILTDPAETGAVTISLPQDVQNEAYDYPAHFFEKRVWSIERRPPLSQRIDQAVRLLKKAQRPVIIAGGGVHYAEAWEDLHRFSQSVGIPVAETFAGRGAIRKKSDLLVGGHGITGNPAAGKIVAAADLVITVGSRLTDFTTGSQGAFQNPDVKFININVSPHDAYKQGALAITADAQVALQMLSKASAIAEIHPIESYLQEICEINRQWNQRVQEEVYSNIPNESMSQGQLLGILNQESRLGDTVVAAAGSPPGDIHKLWEVSDSAACHLEFGCSCMGYELPAAIGVRMAQPQGEVYVFIGDGTYLMNPTEIVTSAQEGLKFTVILSQNHGYQCIRQLQMVKVGHSFGNEFRGRSLATNRLEGDYVEIDFAKNAESMGARAWQVRTESELRKALHEARAERRPSIIVVETEKYRYTPGSDVWWDISAAEISNDPSTRKLRAEYEQGREAFQRFHY